MRVQATAKVLVVLEVESDGLWGPDCSIDQVQRQARDGAVQRVNKAFTNNPAGVRLVSVNRVDIILKTEG
jgi:hypothetical protein